MRIAITLIFSLMSNLLFGQSEILTIYSVNGMVSEFSLGAKPKIEFQNESLMVFTSKETVLFPLSRLQKFTLNRQSIDYNAKDITINDDELISFDNNSDVDSCDITYIRTFEDTNWQALYVPFEIDCISYNVDFDFAVINNFHQYDDDDDGVFDRAVLEIRKVTSDETLLPNHPYLIRSKEIGTKTLITRNATLYATDVNIIDCSSVETSYTFYGNYNTLTELSENGYYYLSDGLLKVAISSAEELQPFRWYMERKHRNSQFKEDPIAIFKSNIKVREIGEENVTNIISVVSNDNETSTAIYSLDGKRISQVNKKGIYIIRMKDGSFRKVMLH